MARDDYHDLGFVACGIRCGNKTQDRVLGVLAEQRALDCMGNLRYRVGIGIAASWLSGYEHPRRD